jgi:hypothetical protein
MIVVSDSVSITEGRDGRTESVSASTIPFSTTARPEVPRYGSSVAAPEESVLKWDDSSSTAMCVRNRLANTILCTFHFERQKLISCGIVRGHYTSSCREHLGGRANDECDKT